MIELKLYNPQFKNLWNTVLNNSRNGTFLFNRDYMDYHSDRFPDHSYLIERKGKVVGFIPGTIDGTTFISHKGLTYGGLVTNNKIKTTEIIEVFSQLDQVLKEQNVDEVIYKPVPLIYHTVPAQEDLYALFLKKAEKTACQISSTIFQDNKIHFTESRKSGIRKSKKERITIKESSDFKSFWQILEGNLTEKFARKPVHSEEEIEILQGKFPNNIKLYVAELNDSPVAGTVLFITKEVVHVQYISANADGKESGGLDLLFDELINSVYAGVPVFDFGHSTEEMGLVLNENLIFQKEGFGGRGTVYETYRYRIKDV